MKEVAKRFVAAESIIVEDLGSGNINDTFLVTADLRKFVLQRINGQVFPQPQNVARNTACVSEYLRDQQGKDDNLCFAEILPAEDGKRWYLDDDGTVWRAQSYIAGTRVYDTIEQPPYAREVGKCLGRFHQLLAGLEPHRLVAVLPGFHDLSGYLKNYDAAAPASPQTNCEKSRYCSAFIKRMRKRTGFFDDAVKSGVLTRQIVHGDPKINNFLFQEKSGTAVALIDLDTVGSGLVLQDIGDAIRSCCCPVKEGNETAIGQCDTSLLRAFLEGYLVCAELSDFERRHVFDALVLITFELGLRFFTDYLQGNIYFKVNDDHENLRRATQQFSLAENVQTREPIIREITQKITKK